MILKFKRFGARQVLRRIGRDLLDRFLQQFQSQLQLPGLELPPPSVSDETYFNQAANGLATPEKLPVALTEALFRSVMLYRALSNARGNRSQLRFLWGWKIC